MSDYHLSGSGRYHRTLFRRLYGSVRGRKDGGKVFYDIDQIQTNDNQTKSGIIDSFVESVENDTEPAVPGKSVLSAMKAIFGSLKSSELGRCVRVDEEELE